MPFEFALNGLRLKAGFSRALYESRTGLAVATFGESGSAGE